MLLRHLESHYEIYVFLILDFIDDFGAFGVAIKEVV